MQVPSPTLLVQQRRETNVAAMGLSREPPGSVIDFETATAGTTAGDVSGRLSFLMQRLQLARFPCAGEAKIEPRLALSCDHIE